MRRLLLAAACSFLALTAPAAATTIALPPPPYVHFDLGPGVGTKATTYAYGADQRMEVVRQGQVVAQSTGTSGGRGTVMTPGLLAGRRGQRLRQRHAALQRDLRRHAHDRRGVRRAVLVHVHARKSAATSGARE